MEKIDIGFVVLAYRNSEDLIDSIPSIKKSYSLYQYKVLVVNSLYDEKSEEEIHKVAIDNGCDYLCIENKGYGYGNNKGIEYFCLNYQFDYIVIANPDTLILKNSFDYHKYQDKAFVLAPRIKNKCGKHQNPYWVINNPIAEYLIYCGHKKKRKFLLFLGLGLNRILRDVFHIKRYYHFRKVFACHGCFFIMTSKVIELIHSPFDEKMFLFAEENLLAHVLKAKGIPIMYTDDVEVLHKEDGSMTLANIDENNELSKSIIYYYEKITKDNETKSK